jgi:hypothetical protein
MRDLTPSEAKSLHCDYLDELATFLGLPFAMVGTLGEMGGTDNILFEAEHRQVGDEVYRTSIIQPTRNVWYGARTVPDRWYAWLRRLDLEQPIYDHGCGVGYTLAWLQLAGYTDLWGWDVPGVQADFATSFLANRGINWGVPRTVGTVLCINVLEHLSNPMETLEMLRAMGGKVYANCAPGKGHGHIASPEEVEAVNATLHKQGEHFEDYMEVGS